MKKLLWLFVAVLFFSGPSLAAQEDYSLQYREQRGPIRYRTEMEFQFALHLPKEAKMQPLEGRMVFRYDSTELWTIAGESTIRCSTTIDKMEIEYDFFNQKNSMKEDNLPADRAAEIVISPQGEVIDIVLPTLPTEADETEAVQPMSAVYQEKILAVTKMFYNLIYHAFPKHSVKQGDRWELTYVLPRLSREPGDPKLLPVTYELSKVRKSGGKRYATLLTSGQSVFDTVIDPKAFVNRNRAGSDAEADSEETPEEISEEEQEANMASSLNQIAIILPIQWKGKIVFGIDDGLIRERELELKGDGRMEFMSYLEKVSVRMTFETNLKMKRL